MYADATPITADNSRQRLDEISRAIIGAAHRVSSTLGFGFLEKVYENALAMELKGRGFTVDQQRPIHVHYGNEIVGDYVTDLLVEEAIVVEVKAATGLDAVHHAQCVNYLRATGYRVCLLLNFGRSRLELRRIVCNF
jgi:GxxExxY protein